ncbi:ATP-binding cassette domain-containing protein [Candidatus Nomurabacteria bacterium]|nr:ATP-binding cassette domain-containing protein [Candidatus Nomurabacteria bacterium]
MSLLEIRELNVSFYDKNHPILAIKDLNLDLDWKESICIVGESGSGKSVLAESILGLHDSAHVSGSIKFKGRDILKMK